MKGPLNPFGGKAKRYGNGACVGVDGVEGEEVDDI